MKRNAGQSLASLRLRLRTSCRPQGAICTTLAVALFYGLLIFVMTLPMGSQLMGGRHLGEKLLGEDIDIWIFYWNNWWIERAVQEGRPWFFTPYIFYPQGVSLLTHSNAFVNSVLALALRSFMGPIAAYNSVILFGLWVGAIGMAWLVKVLTHRKAAALLAGFVFTFAPYHLTQALAHGHLGSIHWWPYYALFLHYTLVRERWSDVLLTAFFAALTFWSGLQLAVLLALWSMGYIGWRFISTFRLEERARSPTADRSSHAQKLWHLVMRLLSVGVLTVILCAPQLVPLIQKHALLVQTSASFDQSDRQQTDVLAYVLPPRYNPVVGDLTKPLYQNFPVNYKYIPYLGYAVMVLAVLAAFGHRRDKWFWLLSTGLWVLMAIGPSLRVNGRRYPTIRLPYGLVKDVFPISTMRSSDRFNLLVVFSLAVLAGLGSAELMTRYLKRPWRKRWVFHLLGFVALVEYWCAPLPMTPPPASSPFLTGLAHEAQSYALVDCPMGYRYGKWWTYYQTLHGKPIIGGHLSRYTPDTYAFIASEPLLRTFFRKSDSFPLELDRALFKDDVLPASALGPALRSLEQANVRYILFHKAFFSPDLYAVYREHFPFAPLYEDERIEVYDVRQPLPFYYGVLDTSGENGRARSPISAHLGQETFGEQKAGENGWARSPTVALHLGQETFGEQKAGENGWARSPTVALHLGQETFGEQKEAVDALFLDHLEIQHENQGQDWRFRWIVHTDTAPTKTAMCQMVLIEDDVDNTAHHASDPVPVWEPLPTGWTWAAGDVGYYEITTHIPEDLPAGVYHWRFRCRSDQGPLAVATQNLASLQERFPVASSAAAVMSTALKKYDDGLITYLQEETIYDFGERIRLRGYRWEVMQGATLHVELLWEALKAPSERYKVFVHLLDQAGELVRQYDAEPCNWQCPTRTWKVGQRILDAAEVPIGGLAPGVYQLSVGFYDPTTLERLPVRGPQGVIMSNATVPLSSQLVVLPAIFPK